MPPRKHNKRIKHQKKQLKIIQSRLMEISIMIENYIYKHRPITHEDALMYYQEVSSYKDQNENDARILQVIEKLQRQLKSIIEETQDIANSFNVQEIIENSINVCPTSPTYSIDNEDGAPVPLYDEEKAVEKETSNGTEHYAIFTEIRAIATENNFLAKNGPTETTDLCMINDESIETGMEKQDYFGISNIKDIGRSFSQLTVTKEKAEKSPNVIQIISNEPAVTSGASTSDNQRPENNNPTYSKDVPQKNLNILPDGNRNLFQNVRQTVNVLRQGTTSVTTNNNALSQITNNVVNKQNNKFEDTQLQSVPRKKQRRTKKIKENESKKSKKEIPKKREIKKPKTKQSLNTDRTVNKKQLSRPTNNYFNKPAEVISHNKIDFINHNDPINILYNSNVENDLSWIENIRYVREVGPDEIDQKLTYIDDSFWNTLDLPTNWNDQDFLY